MLALPEAQFFTGIDWASAEHAVCVLDAAGKITAQLTITHSAEGIASLVRRLARYGDPADLPVAIERPSGRLVDLLLQAGHPVVPVSPNAIKTWREGEVLSGAKSDLLTELRGGVPQVSGQIASRVARFADHDHGRGSAAGSVAAGGAFARVA
jgi:Transposase